MRRIAALETPAASGAAMELKLFLLGMV